MAFSYQQMQRQPLLPSPPIHKISGGSWGFRNLFGFNSKQNRMSSSNYYEPEVSCSNLNESSLGLLSLIRMTITMNDLFVALFNNRCLCVRDAHKRIQI